MSKIANPPKTKPVVPAASVSASSREANPLIAAHLRLGWWCLLIFLTLGIVLESLHGFKAASYLGVSNETRRLLWTLAHANGTLLALINLTFAFTFSQFGEATTPRLQFASRSLYAATVLIPAGFFLGGAFHYSGTPGIGIWLAATGGLLLLAAVLLTSLSFRSKAG